MPILQSGQKPVPTHQKRLHTLQRLHRVKISQEMAAAKGASMSLKLSLMTKMIRRPAYNACKHDVNVNFCGWRWFKHVNIVGAKAKFNAYWWGVVSVAQRQTSAHDEDEAKVFLIKESMVNEAIAKAPLH
ncbi:hypothetical protein BU15DRAFT_83189 [Melanogaster broomeanus]|nr:hypothetical protein BU15DRAFT_83189 [Melanogaster broomeanus]